jgi:hypothetical protein
MGITDFTATNLTPHCTYMHLPATVLYLGVPRCVLGHTWYTILSLIFHAVTYLDNTHYSLFSRPFSHTRPHSHSNSCPVAPPHTRPPLPPANPVVLEGVLLLASLPASLTPSMALQSPPCAVLTSQSNSPPTSPGLGLLDLPSPRRSVTASSRRSSQSPLQLPPQLAGT